MGDRFNIRKYSAAEVVLLGIFALGLGLGSFIVGHRNKIRLSGSIELKLAGLGVSLPAGGGWRGLEEWKYDPSKDMFFLMGQLNVGSRVGAIVQWRYMAASEMLRPEEQLSKDARAREVEVEIVDAGQIGGDVVMEWAQAKMSDGAEDIFFGIAHLGHGRIVELEVVTFAESELGGRVFQAIAHSLKLRPVDLLDQGGRV
jgi:hypothetical protein